LLFLQDQTDWNNSADHILPRLLSALLNRLVHLRPITERCYYNSSQGSWSIQKVPPAITGRGFEGLDGAKDGGMAMKAYVEAIAPETTALKPISPDVRRGHWQGDIEKGASSRRGSRYQLVVVDRWI
jgi:hypothetical protein